MLHVTADPGFSPDGTKIVFETWRFGGHENILIYNIATQELQQITFSTPNAAMPDWSPNGNRLVVTGNINSNRGAYIINM